MRKVVITTLQIGVLCLFTVLGDALSHCIDHVVPGPIIGLVVLFVLLQTKVLPLKFVEIGGNWLVANLLLFFVPAGVGIIQYKHLILNDGVALLALIVVGTFVVMTCSGVVVELILKVRHHRRSEHHAVGH